jgi:predicted DNA-binding protein
MPAKNPRINVVLDDPIYRHVRFLADKDGVSLSTKVRDLIREALATEEDIYLAAFAEEREKSFAESSVLSHEETWS